MQNWAKQELQTAALTDARLNRRLMEIVD
ncbi:MAG: hypothetical protein HC857_11655 [Synechococcales cyanobacterium RU_4_20]|nr:hypothetical protein [Synechococcales cyanobacterium RU_4_20]NJR67555.1 hypothetical protein [Synechococcales cyanobacterium CRU_2_2]